MADPRPITWSELMDFQSRVVTRRQALSHGVSRKAVSRRSKSGAWQRLQRGTYAAFSGVPPREARLWAAVLRAGPGAVLSHETAAEVHGFIDKPGSKIHITVPANRKPAESGRIPGVVIHRSRNISSQPLPPWQLPRTPVAETVLDLVAASRTFDDAYSWLSRATGRQLATAGMIREALAARTRMRWRRWFIDALDDVAEGIMFPLERRYVRDVCAAAVLTARSKPDNSPGSAEVPRMRRSSWRRKSGSSSGPLGRPQAPRERPAGWRATAASAAVRFEYRVKSASASVVRATWAVAQELVRHDRRVMSQAMAPTMNVAAMMPTQVRFGNPRYSMAGVSAASVRQ